jgi:pilus assembly protein CpaE
MTQAITNRQSALTALLIAPDRDISGQFTKVCECLNAFEIMAELKSYPTEQTLEIRLRQLDPDVILLDVATDQARALALISHVTRVSFGVSIMALDGASEPDMVVRILRAGASEYLQSPFEETTMREAVARLVRLRRPDPGGPGEIGTVLAFSSVKPGSGSSTLALQTAFALSRTTGQRVLLVDLDVAGGTAGFCLKLDLSTSVVDAVEQADRMNPSLWNSLAGSCEGIDVLPAPAIPADEAADPARIQTVLDHARTMYDWIVVDLPVALERTSLITMSQTDRVFLISTAELPSLHLARRAVGTLEQLGFPKERCEIVVNRVDARSKLKMSELEKLLRCRVHGTLPDDYFSLHRAVAMGEPLPPDEELGASIEGLAARSAEIAALLKQSTQAALDPAPLSSFS